MFVFAQVGTWHVLSGQMRMKKPVQEFVSSTVREESVKMLRRADQQTHATGYSIGSKNGDGHVCWRVVFYFGTYKGELSKL